MWQCGDMGQRHGPGTISPKSFFSTLDWEPLRQSSFATQRYTQRARSELINQSFNPLRTSPFSTLRHD